MPQNHSESSQSARIRISIVLANHHASDLRKEMIGTTKHNKSRRQSWEALSHIVITCVLLALFSVDLGTSDINQEALF